ncbi:hypothetical protein N8886_00290 [Candidatus Pelagibacter ubique]|nr:hypothetical protein [Candidatus Pelagibacter ubique]MDA7689374.1 hypothetical protein [Candidatus Pelagibacter sp.]MDC1113441.1 hypothetical protein [Candidatus Pelagibacter ubique]
MKKILGIVVLGLLWCSFVYASKTLIYSNYKKNPTSESYIEHLKSVESGISWMNGEDNPKIYCEPKNLEVNIGNITTAINLGVKQFKKLNYTNTEIDKLPVEFIMIQGLKVLFPCK